MKQEMMAVAQTQLKADEFKITLIFLLPRFFILLRDNTEMKPEAVQYCIVLTAEEDNLSKSLLKTCFLGLKIPNGTSINSAVSVQLTTECPYTL